LREMQHRGGGHDGWLQHLLELRRFEVRMITSGRNLLPR
jgi:hypothetical protein